MQYQKPPLSVDDQVRKLEQRGLILGDRARVARYLCSIGFYRLSAYFIPYEDRTQTETHHAFVPDTRFDDILDLYIFDRRLRLHVMEALERIEVAVRAHWVNALSMETAQAHAYMKPEWFKTPRTHLQQLNKAAIDLDSSHERFVEHYRSTYSEPFLPPNWAMAETLSFGALSRWYANTKNNDTKKQVAQALGIPTVELMEGVLEALTLVRNTCAHHSRLWNRQFTKQVPNIRRLQPTLIIHQTTDQNGHSQWQADRRLYNYLVVITHVMKTLQPQTGWQSRVAQHINQLNDTHQAAMGFPAQWQAHQFWRDALSHAVQEQEVI